MSTATAFTVTGLTNGTRYYFRVYAVNDGGNRPRQQRRQHHPADCPDGTPIVGGSPDEPVRPDPPDLGGAAVERWLGDHRLHHPALPQRHDRLGDHQRRRQHRHRVHRDRPGQRHPLLLPGPRQERSPDSPASNTTSAIPRTKPTAPRSLAAAATGASGQIRLAWLAPSSNGGSAITDYVIQRSPNGTTGWVTISDGVSTATAYTVTGLTNGTRYYFRVFARNVVGRARRATPPTPSRDTCSRRRGR